MRSSQARLIRLTKEVKTHEFRLSVTNLAFACATGNVLHMRLLHGSTSKYCTPCNSMPGMICQHFLSLKFKGTE